MAIRRHALSARPTGRRAGPVGDEPEDAPGCLALSSWMSRSTSSHSVVSRTPRHLAGQAVELPVVLVLDVEEVLGLGEDRGAVGAEQAEVGDGSAHSVSWPLVRIDSARSATSRWWRRSSSRISRARKANAGESVLSANRS